MQLDSIMLSKATQIKKEAKPNQTTCSSPLYAYVMHAYADSVRVGAVKCLERKPSKDRCQGRRRVGIEAKGH